MIFRATQKVSSKLQISCTAITESDLSMVEWYCNLISVQRRLFFLFTHAPSLFSFWAPAAGTTRDEFGQMFRLCATDTLRDYGFSSGDTAKVIDSGPDVFAKATDRGVIGSMVDYAKMLRNAIDYEGGLQHLGPRAMNDIANESPMGKIGMENPAEYLRQLLRTEKLHNLALHWAGARVARSGRWSRALGRALKRRAQASRCTREDRGNQAKGEGHMATTDLERAIERSHEALALILKGDSSGYKALFSQGEDITLGNPFGPYARGRKKVEATLDGAASHYRDGQVTAAELIATYASADLTCVVEVEHGTAKVGGGAELVPIAARVTSLFRREQGEWRLVHRHADPITTPRPAESVIRK